MGYRLVTGRYVLGVSYGESRPKSENWATLTPRSSATVPTYGCDKSRPGNSLALGLQLQCSKRYLSAVHHVTCSLLWVTCLFDRLRQMFDFPVPASGLWSRSGSKVGQFVHVPTPDTCWHTKFHPNPCTRFWVILLTDRQTDRQTDKHRGQSHIPPPLSEVNNVELNVLAVYRRTRCWHAAWRSKRLRHDDTREWDLPAEI